MNEPILELDGLTKVYPGGLKALDNIVRMLEAFNLPDIASPRKGGAEKSGKQHTADDDSGVGGTEPPSKT